MQFKIGILGETRAGKDTVAGMIKQWLRSGEHGGYVHTFAFSDGIHELLHEFIPGVYDHGKPRKALQEVGQLLRQFDPDVWINRLLEGTPYWFADMGGEHVLVTDVRQPNEALALRKEEFFLIKVTANTADRVARMQAEGDNFTADSLSHETEQAVHSCVYDYELSNNGTLEELQEKVIALLTRIAEEHGGNT